MLPPLRSSTPTTLNGTFLMRIEEPTALPPGNRLSATVAPSTATLADERTSTSVKKSPSAVFQARMNGQSTSTPQTCVPQLSSPATIWALVRAPAEA
jgi:hypothetical protein